METYVEYDICVNKKTYHVTVSEEHNDKQTVIALTFTDGKDIHISIGKAFCNPTDEFDLAVGVKTAVKDCTDYGFYGYRVGLDDAIWHGFRRAQWHKLHDVTDEQMMITHWMPIENVKKQGDDGWISVEKELPKSETNSSCGSIDVEAKDKDGKIYHRAWCHVIKTCEYYGEWSKVEMNYTRPSVEIHNIIAWRPMRGDK